ncbi:ATP-binding cassette domain-containing protein, partial [Francisella tularensis]
MKGGHSLKVLDNIKFTHYEGEVVALVGKSGSGKST